MTLKLSRSQVTAQSPQPIPKAYVREDTSSKDIYRKYFENIKRAMSWSEKTYKQQLMVILHEYRKEHRFCCTPAIVGLLKAKDI